MQEQKYVGGIERGLEISPDRGDLILDLVPTNGHSLGVEMGSSDHQCLWFNIRTKP